MVFEVTTVNNQKKVPPEEEIAPFMNKKSFRRDLRYQKRRQGVISN